jgi:hypothetical protein
MAVGFGDIPVQVIDFVRGVFANANDKVSRALTRHPSMHETYLDHALITELTVTPATFFAAHRMAVAIDSHWLGGRAMYERWEIADIAFCVTLREHGKLALRKIALLQTKRLYSKEIPIADLDRADYAIGIGTIIDLVDPQFPLSTQRAFKFEGQCVYGAIEAGGKQARRIDEYSAKTHLPVYYALYNPIRLPYSDQYPITSGSALRGTNLIGCRVLPATDVHAALSKRHTGSSPRYVDLRVQAPLDASDRRSRYGWRLERFVADEVLRCRQGRIFDNTSDPHLQGLLYERSAPISAAIAITIDFGAEG